jgi:hypothetical protein
VAPFFDRLTFSIPRSSPSRNASLSPLRSFRNLLNLYCEQGTLDSNGFYVLPATEELFPSAAPSDSEDDDLPSVEEIIVRAGRAPKRPAVDLTGDNADYDVAVSWRRKPPGQLGITRSWLTPDRLFRACLTQFSSLCRPHPVRLPTLSVKPLRRVGERPYRGYNLPINRYLDTTSHPLSEFGYRGPYANPPRLN